MAVYKRWKGRKITAEIDTGRRLTGRSSSGLEGVASFKRCQKRAHKLRQNVPKQN